MQLFSNILAATDTRYNSTTVVDQAAEVARAFDAKLTLVDVLPAFSWIMSFSTKDAQLLRQRLSEEKERKLEQLAEPIRSSGVDVVTRVLHGKSSSALTKEVIENDFDLLVRFAKGVDSGRKGFFGSTASQLLHRCPCPLWLATLNAELNPKHIAASVDTSSDDPLDDELNTSIASISCGLAKQFESRLSMLHVWSFWDEQMLRKHMNDKEIRMLRDSAESRTKQVFEQFIDLHDCDSVAESQILHGDVQEVIPAFVEKETVDLLVMGSVARSWLTGAVVGNTAEKILSQLTCSLLALKPLEFRTKH